jgi:L-ascorbate metabolism protein UlaG (beta-lactamase superfamily)
MTLPTSDHFNGKTFFQDHHATAIRRRDFWRWRLTTRSTPWPRTIALAPQPPAPEAKLDDVVVTWIGHASFLVRTTRLNFLIDPVFSERASPVTWAGPQRAHPPGTALADLPPIDVVLLSHDHYDHFDLATVSALSARHDPLFITPLRHADLLAKARAPRSAELDWWQSHALADRDRVSFTLTPSKHWSNRFGTPRNHRLWGGFMITVGPKRIWFVGDSGYDAALFRRVRERCGPPDLALIPIGAYEPRWFMAPMHMNPEEAVRTHRDIGARRSIAMHWGTFQLTDEGRDDPVHALQRARRDAGLPADDFVVLAPGESLVA